MLACIASCHTCLAGGPCATRSELLTDPAKSDWVDRLCVLQMGSAEQCRLKRARCDPAAAQWAVVRVGMPVKMTE
eukprot:357028-Chlamydomonas_euryale.AAC.2